MQKLVNFFWVLLFSAFFTFSVVAAEEPNSRQQENASRERKISDITEEKQPYHLDEIVVTASRYETLRADTPDTIQVITRKDIEEINPRTTGELFEYITGASVETGTGSGLPDRSIIGLDGLPADRTLVLIDGVKLLTEHIHTGQNIDLIPPQSIERIEILRGAASAQYGSDAIGGVINIITRKATDKTEGDFGMAFGSNDYFDSGLSFLTPIGDKIRLSHFLFWEQSDGIDIIAPARRKGFMGYDRLNSFNRVDVELSEKTDLFGAWNYVHNSVDWSSTSDWPESELKSGVLGLNQKISDTLDLTTQVAYSSWWAEQSSEKNKLLEPEAFLTWRGIENHTVVFGVDNKFNEFERSNVLNHDQMAYALYVQDNWKINEEWALTSALRWDKVEGVESAISPKISLLYQPAWLENTYRIRASVGRSFHAPTLQELYEEGYGHGGRARRYGNPDLEPEYATSYSLGIETTPDKPFSTDWRVFLIDLDDMIVPYYDGPVPGDPAHDVWRRMNIGEARVYGAEASMRWNITQALRFNAGLTYSENERRDTDGQLPYSPGTSGFAKLIMNQPIDKGISVRLFLGAHAAFNREAWNWTPASGTAPDNPDGLVTSLDDYVNLSSGISLFLGNNTELFFKAENLLGQEIANLDDVYTVREGEPAFYFGLNYKMKF